MKNLKKFNGFKTNEGLEDDFKKGTEKTITDLIGSFDKSIGHISITDKGIYTNFSKSDFKWNGNLICELSSLGRGKDGYKMYSVYVKESGDKYCGEFGYILTKDDKPYIICTIPGDDRGAYITNNGTFVVAGHDGFCQFNLEKPELFDSITW